MKIKLFIMLSLFLTFSCDPVRKKSINENPRTSPKSAPDCVQKTNLSPEKKSVIDSEPKQKEPTYRVDHIIDGDTVWVVGASDADTPSERFKVRVLGIDCPEVSVNSNCEKDAKRGGLTCAQQIPLGKKVRTVTERQLKNKTVHLVSGTEKPPQKDKYRRLLAYIEFPNGDDYGLQMVKTKQCDPSYFKHPRQAQYGKP